MPRGMLELTFFDLDFAGNARELITAHGVHAYHLTADDGHPLTNPGSTSAVDVRRAGERVMFKSLEKGVGADNPLDADELTDEQARRTVRLEFADTTDAIVELEVGGPPTADSGRNFLFAVRAGCGNPTSSSPSPRRLPPPSTAAPAEVPGLCFEADINFGNTNGNDISTDSRAQTAAECQARCAANADCTHFSFRTTEHAAGSVGCWLKRYPATQTISKFAVRGVVSGPRHCPSPPSSPTPSTAACPNSCLGSAGNVKKRSCGDCACAGCAPRLFAVNCEQIPQPCAPTRSPTVPCEYVGTATPTRSPTRAHTRPPTTPCEIRTPSPTRRPSRVPAPE